jgi:hypothetical protein
VEHDTDLIDAAGLREVLTPHQPFGPGHTEAIDHFGHELAQQLTKAFGSEPEIFDLASGNGSGATTSRCATCARA